MLSGKNVSAELLRASHALTKKRSRSELRRDEEQDHLPVNSSSTSSFGACENSASLEYLPFSAEFSRRGVKTSKMNASFLMKEGERIVSILTKRASNKLEKDILYLKNNSNESSCSTEEKQSEKEAYISALKLKLRKTKLITLQRSLRKEVLEERKRSECYGKVGSKSRFRSFRTLMKEAERAERQISKEMEALERERRRNLLTFLNSLVSHISSFRHFHKEYVWRSRKLIVRSVLRYHEDKARAAERAERRQNDDNDRLLQVLNQTDEYLRQLGAIVKRQRDGSDSYVSLNTQSGTEFSSDILSTENSQNYYKIAHTIKEPVTELPRILQGGTLKQYQIQGLQWLISLYVNHLNGILADEMGLGKTIQAIAFTAYLVEKKNVTGPFLIVVPLSTLSNWELEFEKWTPSLRVVVFRGDARKRRALFENVIQPLNFNVCLTTFEFVSRGKNLLKRIEWRYLIVDEGHRMKNHESRIATILSQQFKSDSRLLMTGTPLQNSLSEFETFESWFSAPFASMPNEKAELSEEETLLIIRRLHQEHVILCEISAWQKVVYRRILRRQKVVFTGLSGRRRHDYLSNPAMQLRKMVNHPYLFYEDYSQQLYLQDKDTEELFRASGKFYMFDMLLQKFLRTGHRILVFNQMTRVIDLQERLLHYRGIAFLRLDGSTKAEQRRYIVEEFNRSDTIYHVLLLTTRAGGLGVNLQTADTVIIFDSDWNPQVDLQAQDRAHRIGQEKEVLVLRIVAANTIEERILERASYKRDMEQKVIRAGMFNETSKDSERQALLRELLRDEEDRSSEGQENRIPDLDAVNLMIARSDDEISIFQNIDKERAQELNGLSPLMEFKEIPCWVLEGIEEEAADINLHDDVTTESYETETREDVPCSSFKSCLSDEDQFSSQMSDLEDATNFGRKRQVENDTTCDWSDMSTLKRSKLSCWTLSDTNFLKDEVEVSSYGTEFVHSTNTENVEYLKCSSDNIIGNVEAENTTTSLSDDERSLKWWEQDDVEEIGHYNDPQEKNVASFM
eukprot:jgi/Galph1/3593/GphlegSOOS_G2301.1